MKNDCLWLQCSHQGPSVNQQDRLQTEEWDLREFSSAKPADLGAGQQRHTSLPPGMSPLPCQILSPKRKKKIKNHPQKRQVLTQYVQRFDS
jgi:hypothetical protein